jgi:sulfur transfer protein SufE
LRGSVELFHISRQSKRAAKPIVTTSQTRKPKPNPENRQQQNVSNCPTQSFLHTQIKHYSEEKTGKHSSKHQTLNIIRASLSVAKLA